MDAQQLKSYLDFATQIAWKSGKILDKFWGTLSDIQEKNFAWDLVTEADKESEELIIQHIRKQFPDHDILSEEAGLHQTDGSEFTWIVDPLDGTTNYTHQYPMVSISIALTHRSKPIVGIVYNPILEEMFAASSGQGCFFNGKQVQVSKVSTLAYSLLATGFAYDRKETSENNYAEFCHITHLSQGVRRGGSAAIDLAYVAAGRLDGFWERGLNPWDIAAGILLIQEAGGLVTSYEGEPLILDSGRLLASNGLIHSQLIEELKKVKDGKTPKYF
jgi:myo-inositol-1(or 4)-monophosphatase